MADMSSEPGRRQPVTLIIPDLHQRLDWLDRILRRELRGRAGASRSVVFLGDYWDVPEFEIGAASPVDTLRRLVELRKKLGERLTLLIGNHDAAYLEPWFTHGIDAGGRAPAAPFACPGWSAETAKALHQELAANPAARALVAEMRFWHEIAGVAITHAGLDNPLWGETADAAISALRALPSPAEVFTEAPALVTARCPLSGGVVPRSGLLWHRALKSPERTYPGLPQIFGHTAYPRTVTSVADSLCIDGRQTIYGLLRHGSSGPRLTVRNDARDGRPVAWATPTTGRADAVMGAELSFMRSARTGWRAEPPPDRIQAGR